MLYFLNLDGTMTLAEPQRVFQGSNNVNTVYVLSAIAPPTALEISFTLPSGLTTAYYPMIYNGATDEYTVPNTTTTVYLRSFLLTSNITAEVGTVGVSVNAVYSNADGTTGNQTSFTGSFNVEYSSIPETVTTGAADELQQALDLLSQYYTQQQAIITGGTNGEYLQSQGNNQLPVWTSFDMDFVTVNRAQSLSNAQKAQARTNIDVYSKNEIDDSVVKYSSGQSLTDTQKAQARTNIGAEGSADSQYTVKVVEQTFTEEQKTQARTNINAACATYGAIGNGATATTGGAVGSGATATSGGAVGSGATVTSGGAVGILATAGAGGAVGGGATAGSGGAIGNGAKATYGGGAIGSGATTEYGGAVGQSATTAEGGAVGYSAKAGQGGAVGYSAKAGRGFSGGYNAQVGQDSDGNYIDAIQLGTGTNNTPKTLQVYNHKVYDSTKDSLYGSYINDKTPAVIETVWSGTLINDGSTTITVNTYSQYDYFILYGTVEGGFCNIIPNINGTYSFAKKSDAVRDVNAFSFVYTDGSFTWGDSGFYADGNFTFVDRAATGVYKLYKIEGVKICKA